MEELILQVHLQVSLTLNDQNLRYRLPGPAAEVFWNTCKHLLKSIAYKILMIMTMQWWWWCWYCDSKKLMKLSEIYLAAPSVLSINRNNEDDEIQMRHLTLGWSQMKPTCPPCLYSPSTGRSWQWWRWQWCRLKSEMETSKIHLSAKSVLINRDVMIMMMMIIMIVQINIRIIIGAIKTSESTCLSHLYSPSTGR